MPSPPNPTATQAQQESRHEDHDSDGHCRGQREHDPGLCLCWAWRRPTGKQVLGEGWEAAGGRNQEDRATYHERHTQALSPQRSPLSSPTAPATQPSSAARGFADAHLLVAPGGWCLERVGSPRWFAGRLLRAGTEIFRDALPCRPVPLQHGDGQRVKKAVGSVGN